MFFINNFNLANIGHTGGQTGSFRAQDYAGNYFQLKKSIISQDFKRLAKAKLTERENFSELISSISSRHLFGQGSAPEVSFVYDNNNKRIMIASKYMQGDSVRTLDDFAKENGVTLNAHHRHVTFVADDPNAEHGEMSLNDEPINSLQDNLAEALVNSAIFGDHDVNPSNILAITENGNTRLVRIDFGHGLNDLLNAPEIMGGRLRNENAMLDFFNRSQVAGVGGAVSKLWRNYEGMIPSTALINAFRKKAAELSEENLASGKSAVLNEFGSLINALNASNDRMNLVNLKRSLNEIYENLTGTKLSKNLAIEQVLQKTIDKSYEYFAKNCRDCLMLADQMEFQMQVDNYLKTGEALPTQPMERLGAQNHMQWIRTDKNSPAFFGTPEKYLEHRSRLLNLESNVSEQSMSRTSSSSSTYSFKELFNNVRKNSAVFSQSNLKEDLADYIEKRNLQSRKTRVFGFSKEVKLEAANALLQAIDDREVIDLSEKHQHALHNGELGKIVAKHLKNAGVKTIDQLIEKAVEANKTQDSEVSDFSINNSPSS